MNVKKIIIATNLDENQVGQKAAISLKNNLEKWFDPKKIEIRHPFKGYNDFGEMSKEKILQWKNTVI